MTSQRSIPPEADKKPHGCSSPILKTLLEPTPRSRSSDNFEKFSPLAGRRSQGDTPLTASPLARRSAVDSSSNADTDARKRVISSTTGNTSTTTPTRLTRDATGNEIFETTDATATGDNPKGPIRSGSANSTDNDRIINKFRSIAQDNVPSSDTKQQSSVVSFKIPGKVNYGVSTDQTKCNSSVGIARSAKSIPPAIAPKPRPWSMTADRKSGKLFLFQLSLK